MNEIRDYKEYRSKDAADGQVVRPLLEPVDGLRYRRGKRSAIFVPNYRRTYHSLKGAADMFTYDIVHKESKATVFMNGDMDIDVTEIVQENITPNIWDSKEIEFHFQNVSFVDSSGIGLLITLVSNLQERGIRIIITHLQPDVEKVFNLLQLPEILGQSVFEHIGEAEDVCK